MDTACVEMKYADGTIIAIAAIAAENGFCDSIYHRSEPLASVPFVLTGSLEGYLRGTPLMD